MSSLRMRLIGLWVLLAMVVAVTMFVAVASFSSKQVMRLAMEAGSSADEAQAMFDQYVGQTLVLGGAVGLILGAFAAWWLLRRVLRPLERLTDATRAVAAGDFGARVPAAPDRELQRLADAFNQMAATLERVEQLRRTLVEDVAHELRTPLTSLQGYVEAMADGVVAPTPDMLRSVNDEILRLTRLVQGLDELARGEATRLREWTRIDLGAIVARSIDLAAPDLAAREITVRVENNPMVGPTNGDPDAIGQVVANLMQNAARYTDPGGAVVVRLSETGGRLRCAIENTGADIPPADLPLIWERLFRVDRSRSRASGGAGIGLAIVRQVVEAHGGRVGAASDAGRTTIWFEIPAGADQRSQSPGRGTAEARTRSISAR